MSERPPLSHPHAQPLPVDGIALAKLDSALLHRRLDLAIALIAIGHEPIENLDDQAADLLELGNAEAACGSRRRAEPNAGGDRRLLRIEGDTVLVAGDVGATQRDLGGFAGELLGPEVD